MTLALGLCLIPCLGVGAGVERVIAGRDAIRIRISALPPGLNPAQAPNGVGELGPQFSPGSTNYLAVGPLPAGGGEVSFPRFDGPRDRLYSSFAMVRTNALSAGAYGPVHFVEEFAGLAAFADPYPAGAGKKGLQVQMLDDALQLGIQQAALNVNLTGLIDLEGGPGAIPWDVDGAPIRFRKSSVEALDRQVRTLTDAKVVVTLILLTYASGQARLDEVMLHPGYDRTAPNHLGAFNSATAEGIRYLRGCIEFLAHRYSDPARSGGRVAHYILGNEVNSHWFWANMGRVSMEQFAESYLVAARVAHTALRTASTSARLFLSLEHHWSMRYPGGDARQAFPGRQFLEYFNRRAREQGDFGWNLAFHPYPENLFEPRTWLDRTATTNDTSPRVTFKNLDVLMRFMDRPIMRFHGQQRRVILSEQGFHTVDGADGERWQAAAYAYAWEQVKRQPGIDAFILHRHVDHGQEGGLRLGLWTRDTNAPGPCVPARPKQIYELFRAAGTPAWEKASAFAWPIVGNPP